jgi:GNAT superfamily N-acetyltransferase
MTEIVVRPGDDDDLAWLVANDGHLDESGLRSKLATGEIVVAEITGERVGLLRLDHLWSAVPFVALVRVVEPARRRGVGRALVAFTADRARARGADVLLSSATADEAAPQAWHLAVGFEECGFIAGLNPGGVGEVVFRMALR